MTDPGTELLSALIRTLDTERQEIICQHCGLIYQQQTSGYQDNAMHGWCPRCHVLSAPPQE